MGAIPLASRVGTLLLVVATASAFVLAAKAWNLDDLKLKPGEALIVALILGAMIVLVELFDVSFPHTVGTFRVSVGSPIALAAGLALGPFGGGIVVVSAVLIESLYRRRAAIKTIVNIANFGLATILGATVYESLALTGEGNTTLSSVRNMAAVCAAGVVFTVVNATALSIIVAPIMGMSPLRMFRTNLSGFYVELLTLPTFGAIVPVLAEQHALALLVLVIPLVGPLLSFRGFEKAAFETRETMEGLADAVERRDPYTHQHSTRVTAHVESILRELPPLPLEMAQGILAVARVHDLGKVAIQDRTLNKPGPLTPEERSEIADHPVIGAEIVDRLWVYRPWADVIRYHHERYDGRGYPDGLQGDKIPLGARIIAVADAFDAMTSDRAYRAAMDRQSAFDELLAKSGTQFDPVVVEAFGRALGFLQPSGALTLAPHGAAQPIPAIPQP
jgi:HD-GYP domain-containing protein (c-di-GMP phosphodiesterase class II)